LEKERVEREAATAELEKAVEAAKESRDPDVLAKPIKRAKKAVEVSAELIASAETLKADLEAERKARDKGGPSESDAEFGVSRGVDFCDVTAVINMDLPTGMPIYRHRIGRTARAGAGGTAISMVVEGDNKEDALLAGLQEAYGSQMHQFHVDMTKLAAFRRDTWPRSLSLCWDGRRRAPAPFFISSLPVWQVPRRRRDAIGHAARGERGAAQGAQARAAQL